MFIITEPVSLYCIGFLTGKSEKECLFLYYVVVGNNAAFVFDLT